MRTLLIDDERTMDVTQIERRYAQGIYALENEGPWDILYLDHDLAGTYQRGEVTGYTIMCWLEKNPQFLPGKIICVSSNPPGRARIEQVIRKLYGK